MSAATPLAGSAGPFAALTPDGSRLHLQHGPIDLIVEAFGRPTQVRDAYARAWDRFRTILDELVTELPLLRRPLGELPSGAVARRMAVAVRPFADVFITPMAAVAGAVADEVLAATIQDGDLDRAYVNDGGDIALFLTPGERFDVGLVPVPDQPALLGTATILASDPARGVATSGRGGRSFSFGIADAVTVLANSGARADAAATVIANAVDLPGHRAVSRTAANALAPDSDLGDRPVTVEVGPLGADEVAAALDAGLAEAERRRAGGLIEAAVLCLRGQVAVAGPVIASAAGRPDEISARARR